MSSFKKSSKIFKGLLIATYAFQILPIPRPWRALTNLWEMGEKMVYLYVPKHKSYDRKS